MSTAEKAESVVYFNVTVSQRPWVFSTRPRDQQMYEYPADWPPHQPALVPGGAALPPPGAPATLFLLGVKPPFPPPPPPAPPFLLSCLRVCSQQPPTADMPKKPRTARV
ncbi:hypothetical protein RRG08_015108 [Elysia crispata]|uniref:Uncharacterized protein n=1 Tax=Elysia crispata TaxID=231223 RepID=A0AAE0ZH60_9GAST|nr:hypothetical protein RRG08_015108 [Elysia crispata]